MIIDTMILAYAVMKESGFCEQSMEVLKRVDVIMAPASVETELLSVIWQWGRKDGQYDLATKAYMVASSLINESIPVKNLWPIALKLAFSRNHSPYDTLFIAAARIHHTRLITYDQKLLSLFPSDAMSAQTFFAQ